MFPATTAGLGAAAAAATMGEMEADAATERRRGAEAARDEVEGPAAEEEEVEVEVEANAAAREGARGATTVDVDSVVERAASRDIFLVEIEASGSVAFGESAFLRGGRCDEKEGAER